MTDDEQAAAAAGSGAYALNAMSATERTAYERLIAESEDLRAETTGLTDTAAELGLALTPVAPPASLRGRLLDLIDGQDSDERTPEAQPAPRIATRSLAMPAGEHLVPRRRARRPRRGVIALLVAAVVAIGVIGVGVPIAQQAAQVAVQASAVARIRAAADAQQSTAHLTNGGAMTVVWSRSLGEAAVDLTRAPSPAAGRTYELWYIGPSGIRAAGTTDGAAVALTGRLSRGDRIGITVEPDGGVVRPTSAPIGLVDPV